jgi:hypothetical protein
MREVALNCEKAIDWAEDNIRDATSRSVDPTLFDNHLTAEEGQEFLRRAGDSAGLLRWTNEARELLRECAELLRLSPKEYQQAYTDRIERTVRDNPIAAAFGFCYEGARREEATAHCRLEMLKAAIDVLDRGTTALREHVDPYAERPFEYTVFDGGFELRSELDDTAPVTLEIGLRR